MTSPWIRRLAIAAAAAGLLVAAAVGVLVAAFDADRFRSLAIDWMKTQHQRTLVIAGPIRLSLFPRLAVEVSGVSLSERGGDGRFAAVDEAALALRVLPLLGRRIVIDRIGARGVGVSVRRDADGSSNLDDFLGSSGPRPAGDTAPSGAAIDWAVSAIDLADLRLALRDASAGVAGDIVVQTLTTGRLADGVAAPVALKATITLAQPRAATMAVDGRLTATPDFARRAVALSDVDLAVSGDGAGITGVALKLSGGLAWTGGALSAGPLRIAVDRATLAGATLVPSTIAVRRALVDPATRRIELDAVQVDVHARHGADTIDAAIDWPQFVVAGDRIGGSGISARLKVSGATSIDATLQSAAPRGSVEKLTWPGLALTGTGRSGPRRIDATGSGTLVVGVDTKRADIGQLVLKATIVDPGLQPLQLAVQGSAGTGTGAARWALDGDINGNRFETHGDADLSGAVPSVAANARFVALDLNRLLRPAAPAAVAGAGASADAPLPLDALKAIDGRFDLGADALAYRRYRVGDARVVATLNDGRLQVSRLSGRVWGGSVDASGSAEAGSHRVALKADAQGVDVGAMLRDVAGKDLLDGSGHVVVDLRSTGRTVGALRGQLAGTAALRLRDGAIKGYDLARSLRQARAALTLKQDALIQASAAERTDFSALSASARIDAGVARSDDLEVKTPFLRIGGDGIFDIGRSRIDYTARATVVATPAGQGGAGIDALRGLTVPVRLTGPFDAIDWQVRWSDVASAAVRQQVRDKLGEVLGGRAGLPDAGAASAPVRPGDVIEDRLKERLKGLFR